MPIPLIAAGLIAVGSATGGTGVVLGGKGARDVAKAKKRIDKSQSSYEVRRGEAESAAERTNQGLKQLGIDQRRALTDVVVRMADFLRRHERQVRESEKLLVEGIEARASRVDGPSSLDVDALSWVRGVVGSAAVGSGTSAGVMTAVTTYGVASTGTAISSLSGAAATNAGMAALGGGSLATGGGGMALGAAALNFVTIGPAVLIGGLTVKRQGSKALTQATAIETKVDVAIAELEALEVGLRGVDERKRELTHLLNRLREKAVIALDELESEDFDPRAHADRFQRALSLVVAVREVATAPVLDEDGQLEESSGNLTVKYRAMAEEDDRG